MINLKVINEPDADVDITVDDYEVNVKFSEKTEETENEVALKFSGKQFIEITGDNKDA